MAGERPLGLTFLATLEAALSIVELNIGILLFAVGNPLPSALPGLDVGLTGTVLVAIGVLGLFISYYLWSGQAFGWVAATMLLAADLIFRILLPVMLGQAWIVYAIFLELDVAMLYYLTRPSATTFFGGESIRAVLQKERVEMEPRIKEIRFTLKLIRKSPLSIVGSAIVLFYVFVALFAPFLAPMGPPSMGQGGDAMMMPHNGMSLIPVAPSAANPFGTMQGQYDIYYGCIWGARSALRIGVIVAGGSLVIGLAVGIIAAYYGGWMDEVLMRLTDIVLAFPGLILSMALIVVLVPIGVARLDAVMLSLVIVGWPGYARLIRGEILRIKNEDYVEAAKSVGCSDLRIIGSHILPNSIYPVLIVFTLDIGTIVLAAAALSFLGLGATIGYADWGQIIALSLNWIYANPAAPFEYWFTFIIPGLFISMFVLGWNLLGDALRDILDPTLRRK
jgi:peptide/nickel transport system permease protein